MVQLPPVLVLSEVGESSQALAPQRLEGPHRAFPLFFREGVNIQHREPPRHLVWQAGAAEIGLVRT